MCPAPGGAHIGGTTGGLGLLHRLPTEILVEILKQCPDLPSLWSLVNTSPGLSSTSDAYAVEVVEAVLSSALPPQIELTIRAVVRIWTDSLPCQSLGEAIKLPASPSALSLDPSASPALLRRLLKLSRKIDVLAHSCLDRCLKECTSIAPLLCASPSLPFGDGSNGDSTGSSCRAGGFGPPTWAEEQRAILAVWRVQFFIDLQLAVLRRHVGWPTLELRDFERVPINVFYPGCMGYQAKMAYDFIDDLETSHSARQQRRSDQQHIRVAQEEFDQTCACFKHLFGLPDPPVGAGCIRNCEPRSSSGSAPQTRWVWRRNEAHYPRVIPLRRCGNWRHGRGPPTSRASWQKVPATPGRPYFDEDTVGWHFLESMRGEDVKTEAREVAQLYQEDFMKYGFFLWDEQRMADLGLWSSPALGVPPVHAHGDVWVRIHRAQRGRS